MSEDMSNSKRDIDKSWYTNPRGDKDPFAANALVVALDKRKGYKSIRKEGEGGGFGEGGGTVFTSTDAGIFTPTHSDTSRTPKKKKKQTGIERLADFLTDNSPERKMSKGDTTIVELINWVKMEMRKEDRKGFKQQTSGETINDQPPRIKWGEGNKEMLDEDNPVEFEAKPNPNAAESQKDEERRIRRLNDSGDKKDDEPKSTGMAQQAAPAGLNIRLSAWRSGRADIDALAQGSSKDKEQGDVEDPEDEHTEDEFIDENEKIMREIIQKIRES